MVHTNNLTCQYCNGIRWSLAPQRHFGGDVPEGWSLLMKMRCFQLWRWRFPHPLRWPPMTRCHPRPPHTDNRRHRHCNGFLDPGTEPAGVAGGDSDSRPVGSSVGGWALAARERPLAPGLERCSQIRLPSFCRWPPLRLPGLDQMRLGLPAPSWPGSRRRGQED